MGEILERPAGTVTPSLTWAELKKIGVQLRTSRVEMRDESLLTLFETTLSTKEEARWARTRDEDDLEASIGVLDSVEAPYRDLRRQKLAGRAAAPMNLTQGNYGSQTRTARVGATGELPKASGPRDLDNRQEPGNYEICGRAGHSKENCWNYIRNSVRRGN